MACVRLLQFLRVAGTAAVEPLLQLNELRLELARLRAVRLAKPALRICMPLQLGGSRRDEVVVDGLNLPARLYWGEGEGEC